MRRTAALLLALAAAGPARATTGAIVLRRPLSARASALAEAYAAVPGGITSLGINPAGLAAARRPELGSTFTSGVLNDSFGFLGWAQPLKWGTLAAGLSYYDAGTVDIVPAGGGAADTRTAERDLVGHLAWASALPGGVALGAAAKFYRFDLAQEAHANGTAADVGAQWAVPGAAGLTLGAAVQNLGKGVKFEQEADPLPLAWRGGLAWTWGHKPETLDPHDMEIGALRTLLTAEAMKVRDERAIGMFGAEAAMDFGAAASIALRMGWQANSDGQGPAFGAGFRESRFQLDYALGDKRALGQVHHVSLGVKF